MKKLITLLALIAWVSFESQAQEVNSDDMFDLTLEELMNISVESSTKSQMNIQRAPSVIRVYTQEDFQKFGFVDLQDVLMSIPGTQIQQYRAGHQLTWIRGVQARYNNKVLLLIDGVPMRDSYYGNFNIDEMIPIEMIERVEVINGPGSVLYGANSFSGVISVKTKDAGKQVGVDYGSFNSISAHGEFSTGGLYGHAGAFSTNGFEPELKSNGLARDIPQNGQNVYGYLKYKSEDLQATFGVMDYEYNYKYRSTDKDYSFERMPIFGSLKYGLDVGENGRLNANAYINEFKFTRNKIKFLNDVTDTLKEMSTNPLDTRIIGTDIEFSQIAGNHNIIAGLSLQRDMAVNVKEVITFDEGDEVRVVEQTLLDNNIARDFTGLFVQDVWNVSSNWSLTGGLRYDILSDFDNQFNYRLGITGNLTSNIYTKLLYGTAYRVPAYREYIDAEAPNANLTPENLATGEFQIGYLMDRADINITLYNNNYSDFISEIVVDSIFEDGAFRVVDDEMAFNFNSRNITGIELNSRLKPTDRLTLDGGISFLLSATSEFGNLDASVYTNDVVPQGKVDIDFLSNTTGYILFNYQLNDRYNVGFNTYYFSDRGVPSNYQDDVPAANRNLDNANGFLKTDVVVNANPFGNMIFNLKLANVFNNQFYSPPFGGSDGFDAEWPGFNFRLAAVYRFN